ncbi:MAG: flagellar biosynthesis anti-sigma factor FlgM [Dehalococcoidia bacterium]
MARNTEIQAPATSNEPVAFDDRTRRVMELKKAVREGTYILDAEAVAKAMLSEWIANGEVTPAGQELPSVESAEDRKAVGARFVVASDPREEDSAATAARSA